MGKTIHCTRYMIALCAEIDPDDGNRMRITGSVSGLFLAGNDQDALWRDLGPTLQTLLQHNEGFPHPDLRKATP